MAAILIIRSQLVDRYTFGISLTFAVAFRLVTLFPAGPALHFLRVPNRDLFDHINCRDYVHTINPPAAQLLFYVITFINPPGIRVTKRIGIRKSAELPLRFLVADDEGSAQR